MDYTHTRALINSTAQHGTAQHSTAQHSTAQHSTAQHSTAQHSTAQPHTCTVGHAHDGGELCVRDPVHRLRGFKTLRLCGHVLVGLQQRVSLQHL